MTAPLDDQVEALFPLGGPYDDATTRAAARSIAGLVRYLNHATRYAEAASQPATVDAVVHDLEATVAGMDQLLEQLDAQMWAHLKRPEVYVTVDVPVATVGQIVTDQLRDIRGRLVPVRKRLQTVGGFTSTIGVDEDGRIS